VAKKGQVRIGTSGYIYRHWRGVFYPESQPVGRWFAFYSQQFDTVEINNTLNGCATSSRSCPGT
jgi:uncharacterized protein YecE (DUF72 family)